MNSKQADSDQVLNANMQMNDDESSNVNTRMDGEENSNVDMQVFTDQSFICNICNISYTLYSSLKRHFKNIHPTQLDNLITPARASKTYQFHCVPCGKNFTKKFHFDYHNRKEHSSEVVPVSKTSVSCFSCGLETEKQNYVGHLQHEHGIVIESEVLELSNIEEFYSWKAKIEKESKENFVVERGARRWGKNKSYYFACHRSGFHIKHSDSKKCSKLKGSKRINGFCPANIKLTCSEETGKCQVKFIKTHIGHSNDLAHLYLTPSEKQSLAAKIAAKIPFDAILDNVRDSISDSGLERIHLLTKMDLHNIQSSFNLNSDVQKHKDDGTSVEAWVNEMNTKDNSCVLFYKPQNSMDETFGELQSNDFVLIIMNEAQQELLKKFGNDCICIDGTHGMNNYDFELITLLVIDDMRQGFPCAFLISNRSDEIILKLFFDCIAKKTGKIAPRVFMSDMAEAFFNAWIKTHNEPELRLFCSWHVDRAWRKNLKKIKNSEKQLEAYKTVRTLLTETDAEAFNIMLDEALKSFSADPDLAEFGQYFFEYYVKNVKSWAYCYRLHAGLNTNMHIERMHKTLKYIYLQGKSVQRLDKAIHAIMRFLRDKLFDRLIFLNKGKLTSKLKDLRKRHKTSLSMSVSVVQTTEGWNISSQHNDEMYAVTKINIGCQCLLKCENCQACIHQYSCTCLDSSVRWNMCKHIHYICHFNKDKSSLLCQGDNELDIHELSSEKDVIVDELRARNSPLCIGMNDRRQALKLKLNAMIDTLNSEEEIKAFEKIFASVKPTIDAIRLHNAEMPPLPHNKEITPVNKKIIPQRRLFSTKKKTSNAARRSIQTPSREEAKNIALQLISKHRSALE